MRYYVIYLRISITIYLCNVFQILNGFNHCIVLLCYGLFRIGTMDTNEIIDKQNTCNLQNYLSHMFTGFLCKERHRNDHKTPS